MIARSAAKHKRVSSGQGNNRLGIVLAVVFLLAGSLVFRLVYLQIFKSNYYNNLASNMHQVVSELAPKRGQIYIQDKHAEDNSGLFAIASSKELMTVFVKPIEIKDKEKLKNGLYEYFKKAPVEKEVDELLRLQEKDRLTNLLKEVDSLPESIRLARAEEIRSGHEAFLKDPSYVLAKTDRRNQMIEDRKKAIMEEYDRVFAKSDDPYEPLEKRVDSRLAREFHLSLIDKSQLPKDFTIDDMEIYGTRFTSNKIKIIPATKDKEAFDPLKFDGLGYESETYRYYPEKEIASHILGFVGFEPEYRNEALGRHGRYGLEGFFDDELFGKFGEVKSEKGAGGITIPNAREMKEQVDGDDLVLTIDRTIQNFITEKVQTATLKYGADNGSIIIMNPMNGEIIAMASYPDFDPNSYDKTKDVGIFNNPVVFDQYEPGSVFKSVTMAAALNEGKVTPNSTYVDTGQVMIKGWPKPIKNSDFDTKGAHGVTTMTGVLDNSLNCGAIHAMQTIGDKKFSEYVQRFGFGEKTGIELDGESSGNIVSLTGKKIREVNAATASFGQGIAVTPIQMTSAYATLINGGKSVKPYLVKEIRHADGTVSVTTPSEGRQIITPQTSSMISGMLVSVVENGHSKKAKIPGYYVGGKTGTAQFVIEGQKGYVESRYNHTFMSFGPLEKPRFIMLIRFKNPKGYTYADSTAVPLSHDVMQFLFDYWQIPKNREVKDKK